MSEPIRSPSAFTAVESDRWEQPPSLSWLAVAALLLGVASPLAVFAPVLWCLPAAAAGLAVAALVSIAKDPGVQLGRRAAVIGLVLSLLFAAWGVSNFLTRQRLLYDQAREVSEYWLNLVREGRLREAHQLQLLQQDRQAPGTDLVEYYGNNQQAREDYGFFLDNAVLRELIDRGPRADLRFDGNQRIEAERERDGFTDVITQRYVLDGQGNRPPLVFLAVLARTRNSDHDEARWRMLEVKTATRPKSSV